MGSPGAHQPVGQRGADFLGADKGSEHLLETQAQAPGRQQGVQWTLIQMSYKRPLRDPATDERKGKGSHDRKGEVRRHVVRRVFLGQRRAEEDGVGANRHELTVSHVDHAHLPEDDRKSKPHQEQNGKQAQTGKALHQGNIEHFRQFHRFSSSRVDQTTTR